MIFFYLIYTVPEETLFLTLLSWLQLTQVLVDYATCHCVLDIVQMGDTQPGKESCPECSCGVVKHWIGWGNCTNFTGMCLFTLLPCWWLVGAPLATELPTAGPGKSWRKYQ